MRLTIKPPSGAEQSLQVYNPQGKSLGQLLGPYAAAVSSCAIDGEFIEDWRGLVPGAHAHVDCFLQPPGGPAAVPVALFVAKAVAAAVIAAGISLAVSALLPAKVTETQGKPEDVFGIAGLTNTVALGTPKFTVYGERRVFGHIISTRVDVAEDGRSMAFGALYFMGNGPVELIKDVEINDTAITLFPGTNWDWRQGFSSQPVIPGFDAITQVFSDGRQIPLAPDNQSPHIIYTGRGTTFDSATLILSSPFLFNTQQSSGRRTTATHHVMVRYKRVSDGTWTDLPGGQVHWSGNSAGLTFRAIAIGLPSKAQWQFQLLVQSTSNENVTLPSLFNVQESESSSLSYPNNALLAIRGVASSQITSFDALRCSAVVRGKIVKIWTGTGYVQAWTEKRPWHVRDMLTDPVNGLGNKISEALIDDQSFLDAANFGAELVPDQSGGQELRDRCDVVLNDRRVGWDWIRDILREGASILVPSQGKLKYITDLNRTPNLLYAMPGNIIPGTLKSTYGTGGSPINTLRIEFPESRRGGRTSVIEVQAADIGAEPLREELAAYKTITRESQAIRLGRYTLAKKRLIKRRFTWTSPSTAQVSEPLDVDKLSYETRHNKRGFSGFVSPGSFGTEVYLDRLVSLRGGATYELVIRHIGPGEANVMDRRTISTPAGTWGVVQVSSPFGSTPKAGDLWAIGEVHVEILPVLIEEVTYRDDLTVDLSVSEFIATIYDNPALPPPTSVPREIHSGALPIPLLAASVINEATIEKDGSTLPMLRFEVTPGQPIRSGTVGAVTATTVLLGSHEPSVNSYFNGAKIKILTGPGAGQERRVTGYEGGTRKVTIDTAWNPLPVSGTSTYQIEFEHFADFEGFDVEADDQSGVFYQLASTDGTLMFLPARGGVMSNTFRFTPYSTQQVRNLNARWIVGVGQQGDITPPSPPSGLTAVGTFNAIVLNWSNPADADFAGVQVFRAQVNDRNQAGFLAETPASGWFDGNLPNGATFYYWVRARDRSNNLSAFHPSGVNSGVQATTAFIDLSDIDTQPPAVPTGLVVTTGTVTSDDGTIMAFVEASVNANTENDLQGYEFQLRYPPSGVPDTKQVSVPRVRWSPVAGGVVVAVKAAAFDRWGNVSAFTAEQQVTTPVDTVGPSPPSNLTVTGSYKANYLLWTPPGDFDLKEVEVWSSTQNNRNTAARVGSGTYSFGHTGLPSGITHFYWIRAVDFSGNVSGFHPSTITGGVPGTTIFIPGGDIPDRTISPTKLIGDLRSLAYNSDFEGGNQGWAAKGPGWTIGFDPAGARSGSWFGVHTGGAGQANSDMLNDAMIPCHPGDQIYLSVFAKGGNGAFWVGLAWYDADNILITGTLLPGLATVGNYTEVVGILAAPANAAYAKPLVRVTGHTSGGWAVDDLLVLTAVTANLIAANIVSANHLRTDVAVITSAAQIANALITNAHILNLSADKITTGTLNALYHIGVGGRLQLDGSQPWMLVYDLNNVLRVQIGKVGGFSTSWGMRIFNENGALIFDLSGVPTDGIQDQAVTAQKIRVGSIDASHMRTDTLVVTNTAQIANLIVGTTKITDHAVTDVFVGGTGQQTMPAGQESYWVFTQIGPVQSSFVLLNAEFNFQISAGDVLEVRIWKQIPNQNPQQLKVQRYQHLPAGIHWLDFSAIDTTPLVSQVYVLGFTLYQNANTLFQAKLSAVQFKK